MTIDTTTTPKPTIIDDKGRPMTYSGGVRLIRRRLNLKTAGLGAHLGVSARTVENWEQGKVPSRAALLLMAALVQREGV